MKKLFAVLATALVVTGTFAGVTITESPASIELHSMPDNKMVPGPWPPNYEACKTLGTDLVKAGKLGDFACVTRNSFKVAATCADEKAPKLFLVKDADGKYPEPDGFAQQVPGTDDWITVQDLYVHSAAWPAGYPNCWVRGVTDSAAWCVSGKDPASVFMARREDYPIECEDDAAANTIEPVCWGSECEAAAS